MATRTYLIKNQWDQATTLRLLGDRKDRSLIPSFQKFVREFGSGNSRLGALWALNACGGLDDDTALEILDIGDPYLQPWTIRLLCDFNHVAPEVAAKLVKVARSENEVEARCQLACSARRLPGSDCLPIVSALLTHDQDASDPQIPLLIWWAIESKAETDRNAVIRRDEIEEMKVAPVSIMPEGPLDGMSDRDLRDLFAYLRGTQPPK